MRVFLVLLVHIGEFVSWVLWSLWTNTCEHGLLTSEWPGPNLKDSDVCAKAVQALVCCVQNIKIFPKDQKNLIYFYVQAQHHGKHLLICEVTLDGSMTQVKSASFILLPFLFSSCSPFLLHVEAANSIFNGMSRKGSIVPACLKYRGSLNNTLPLFKKLTHCCDSEGVLHLLSLTPINFLWLLSSMKGWQAGYCFCLLPFCKHSLVTQCSMLTQMLIYSYSHIFSRFSENMFLCNLPLFVLSSHCITVPVLKANDFGSISRWIESLDK